MADTKDPNAHLLPTGANASDYKQDAHGMLALKDGKVQKKRKAQTSRLPEGHSKVSFVLEGDDANALKMLADEEDRSPEDFARVLVRRAARGHVNHPKNPRNNGGGSGGATTANTGTAGTMSSSRTV